MTTAVDPSLIDVGKVEPILDHHGLGAGPVAVATIGDGHSNLMFLLSRGDDRYVLRRPPRPPYPSSAHDVLREAAVIEAVGAVGLPVPTVLAKVEDAGILGVPFVVMEFVDGYASPTTCRRPSLRPTTRSASAMPCSRRSLTSTLSKSPRRR